MEAPPVSCLGAQLIGIGYAMRLALTCEPLKAAAALTANSSAVKTHALLADVCLVRRRDSVSGFAGIVSQAVEDVSAFDGPYHHRTRKIDAKISPAISPMSSPSGTADGSRGRGAFEDASASSRRSRCGSPNELGAGTPRPPRPATGAVRRPTGPTSRKDDEPPTATKPIGSHSATSRDIRQPTCGKGVDSPQQWRYTPQCGGSG